MGSRNSWLSHVAKVFTPNQFSCHIFFTYSFPFSNDVDRIFYFQFLLGLSNGTHLRCPFVEMIPVFAFRLEPLCEGSHIVVDGEVLPHSSIIQAEIFPGIVSLLNKLPPAENATSSR